MVDVNLYMQTLYNIFLNAYKFTHEKGLIKIKIYFEPEGLHRVKFKTLIHDTGPGISKKKQKELFDLFGKVEKLGSDFGSPLAPH